MLSTALHSSTFLHRAHALLASLASLEQLLALKVDNLKSAFATISLKVNTLVKTLETKLSGGSFDFKDVEAYSSKTESHLSELEEWI